MAKKPLPKEENIYETDCPILFAMDLIGQKWKLPILWYIADAENQTLRYRELERKVVGITATMLTKCLRELEQDRFIKLWPRIPPPLQVAGGIGHPPPMVIQRSRHLDSSLLLLYG